MNDDEYTQLEIINSNLDNISNQLKRIADILEKEHGKNNNNNK